MDTQFDVVIVGGGPVGQVSAILLGQRGHRVAVYDRWPSAFPLPRACSLGHEPARVLQSAHLGPGLRDVLEPVQGEGRQYILQSAAGETLFEIDWNKPGESGWAEMSSFFQPDLEELLAARMRELPNVTFQRGRRVIAVRDEPEQVLITVQDEARSQVIGMAQTQEVSTRFAIGADGANSIVRSEIGTEMVDLGFEYDWLVVDIQPVEPREWNPYFAQRIDPRRPTTSVPSGPGRRRWEFMLLPGESRDTFNQPDTAWQLLAEWDVSPENAKLIRSTVWTFRAEWAHQWRSGRLVLAGDSAHLMPPFLAQGLGSGLRDAAALAWRLDLILRDITTDAVLDSYGPERTAHVTTIIREAVALGELICVSDPEIAKERDARLRAARSDPSLAPAPPPPWRVAPGLATATDDDLAGRLFVQGRVRIGDSVGLLEDLVGAGFAIVSVHGDPAAGLAPAARAIWERLEGHILQIGGAKSPVEDVEGTYVEWFARRKIDLVLVRPDFVIFGSAASVQSAGDLILGLAQTLGIHQTATA